MTRLFPSMRVTVPFWAFGVTIGIFWLAYFTLRAYVSLLDVGPTYRITLWAAAFYGWLACGLNKRASVFETVLPISTRDLFKIRLMVLFAGACLSALPAIAEGFKQALHLGLLMTAAGATILAWRPRRRVVSYRVFSFAAAVGVILDFVLARKSYPTIGVLVLVLWGMAALFYAWQSVPATYEIAAPQRVRQNWTGSVLPPMFPVLRALFPLTFWLMVFTALVEFIDSRGVMAGLTIGMTALSVRVSHPFLDSLPVSRRQRTLFRAAIVFLLAAIDSALFSFIAKLFPVSQSGQISRYLTIVALALICIFTAKCVRWRRLRWLREPFRYVLLAAYVGLLFCLGMEPVWHQVAHKGESIADIILNHLNPWMFPPILLGLVLLLDWQGNETEPAVSTADVFALMRQQQAA